MSQVFIYLLQHFRSQENGEEDIKVIGIYSSEHNAKLAVYNLITKPRFNRFPNNFAIDKYEINRTEWQEGFGFD